MLVQEYNVSRVVSSLLISGRRTVKQSHPMGAIVAKAADEGSIINALRAADYLRAEAVSLDLSGNHPLVISQIDGEAILELIPLA